MKRKNVLEIQIADMPIRIKLDNTRHLAYIKSVLSSYIKPVHKPFFFIHLKATLQKIYLNQEDGIKIIPQNSRFILMNNKRRKFDKQLGFVDKKHRLAKLQVNPGAAKTLFHSFLTSSCALFLSEAEGLIVHACGLIDKGYAYVFIGPSGSGKTTVSSLLKKRGLNVISDEKIVIRKQGSYFMAYSFPWSRDKNQFAPIRKIFFLKKSYRVNFRPLNVTYAIAKIFSDLTLVFFDKDVTERILNTLLLLFKTVPAYEMRFSKDDKFWKVLIDLS